MEYKDIELIKEDRIAFITLNRPEVLNALSETMKVELIHALKETEEDDDIRVVILTGRGRAFCAGADLNRFVEFQKSDKDHKRKQDSGHWICQGFYAVPEAHHRSHQWAVLWFGFTVTLTCDIRLASERARFSCAFVRIASPRICSTYFLQTHRV